MTVDVHLRLKIGGAMRTFVKFSMLLVVCKKLPMMIKVSKAVFCFAVESLNALSGGRSLL